VHKRWIGKVLIKDTLEVLKTLSVFISKIESNEDGMKLP